MSGRQNYWSKELVLKRLRRAVREVFGNDREKLPTNMNQYRRAVQPFNQGVSHCRPLYPSPEAVSRWCGGIQKAWKLLGYDVQVRQAERRKKWKFTSAIDARIREIYSKPTSNGQNFQGGQGVKAFAEELGWPYHVIVKRAADMGLGRVKEKPWTEAEIAALDKLAHYVPSTIASKFRALGFQRTDASIAVMRKRRWAHKGGKFYSGHALQMLMGMGDHAVDRKWVPMGLRFIVKETNKHRRQGGDTRLFHIDEIRRFFIAHPEAIDLQKVDKMWFLEMITAGKFRMVVPSERLSIRSEAPRPGLKAA